MDDRGRTLSARRALRFFWNLVNLYFRDFNETPAEKVARSYHREFRWNNSGRNFESRIVCLWSIGFNNPKMELDFADSAFRWDLNFESNSSSWPVTISKKPHDQIFLENIFPTVVLLSFVFPESNTWFFNDNSRLKIRIAIAVAVKYFQLR